MADYTNSSCPNWSRIFAKRPDLEAPGHQEAVRAIRDQKNKEQAERIKSMMQDIQKQRVSQRNKAKNRKK